ncbi:MAG TPA: FAD-dependent monooxygenase [Rhodopila sp.]|uniref:FAD-dependent monooxygenase n=1 Tax=Rhodopila sp. TaxID=2480087 RepID=UPI002D006394|nr:FAD-dependent monooxygenase [Rhodopila sp.]HVY13697.1 FAD-dependent monooxygenase [Rhodopila sp.]
MTSATGSTTPVDVLIVGAGPVGLLLATELLRDGVSVALIDRMTQRSFFCKALGITARTLEIFDDLGIAQDAIDAGVWLNGLSSFTDGVPGQSMDIPPVLPFGSLMLAQHGTEGVLEACLRRHGGAVSYGSTLIGFTETGNGISAQVAGPDQAVRTIGCRWLVGCDGAHSKVRSVLGLDFEGGQYPQAFVLADLEVDWNLPRGRLYRFNHSGTADRAGTTLVAVPVAGSQQRYRLSTVLPDEPGPADGTAPDVAAGATTGTEAPAPPSLDRITALMAPLLPAGTKLSSLHWSSVYRVSHRIVSHYARGRVFLAGDAAHLHPPIGGLGMNTGLQDAHNLAWKLALAKRGLAAPGLLDSYAAERRAVGLDVVENTSRALNESLMQRAPMPGMRETQLLVGYRGSAIVRDDGAGTADALLAAGDRVPDAGPLRRAYVEQSFRLHERLGRGRHVLFAYLDAADARVDAFVEMLALLRATVGEATSGFIVAPQRTGTGTGTGTGVGAGAEADREDVPVLHDAAGAFAAAFGAAPGMTWLTRPDGYLGWCCEVPSIAGLWAALRLIAMAVG